MPAARATRSISPNTGGVSDLASRLVPRLPPELLTVVVPLIVTDGGDVILDDESTPIGPSFPL
jgi:hypothetical protein